MASSLESRLDRLERVAATRHAREQAPALVIEYLETDGDGYPAGEPEFAFEVDPARPERIGAKL